MERLDGRKSGELRPVKITRHFIKHAEGSVLIEMGDTKVICTATIEDKVPPFLKGTGSGWVTAEYGMLPRSTGTRMQREASKGKQGGRTLEIQRLIGRALRPIVDLQKLGERTIWVDCDVIQADGGTRTASVTGAYVAVFDALKKLHDEGVLSELPILDSVAAVSVGIVDGEPCLDLCYAEDSQAEVDMNVVMTGEGKFIEIQGTAEKNPFSLKEGLELLELAKKGIEELIGIQKQVLTEMNYNRKEDRAYAPDCSCDS